jgi:hypothetical protein
VSFTGGFTGLEQLDPTEPLHDDTLPLQPDDCFALALQLPLQQTPLL